VSGLSARSFVQFKVHEAVLRAIFFAPAGYRLSVSLRCAGRHPVLASPFLVLANEVEK